MIKLKETCDRKMRIELFRHTCKGHFGFKNTNLITFPYCQNSILSRNIWTTLIASWSVLCLTLCYLSRSLLLALNRLTKHLSIRYYLSICPDLIVDRITLNDSFYHTFRQVDKPLPTPPLFAHG